MNFKKILKSSCILMIIIVLINIGSVYGAINAGYHADTVSENWITDVAGKSNILIDPIMRFIYWIGTVIEYLVGSVAALISNGNAVFPWSDAILFNAVPILDINFINPDSGSLIKLLDGVIVKTYMTVLSMSIAFFGLIVLVMAIKLAISTIASDKAKYKEEIFKWATSLVLLFTIHFFISFVFYANESLVQVASGIVTDNLPNFSLGIDDDTAYTNLLHKDDTSWWTSADTKDKYAGILENNKPMVMSILDEERGSVAKDFFHLDKWYVPNGTEVKWITGFVNVVNNMKPEDLKAIQDYEKGDSNSGAIKTMIETLSDNQLASSAIDLDGQLDTWKRLTKKYYNSFNKNSPNFSTKAIATPITDLATYFRKNAFSLGEGDVVRDKPDYMFCMLYLIFCVQSFMYFLAYIKRLFYIILLSILAPVIVLFNYASGIAGKASALSKWIKEFIALVFIQTIQAFILAIVFVIIATTANMTQSQELKSRNSALGVVAIVALASIGKVESLLKKILGVESSITDTSIKGGMKSWMTGMAAAKVAMRTKDNFKKVGSGISTQRSLKKQENEAKLRLSRRLSLYNASNNDTGAETGVDTETGAGTGTGGGTGTGAGTGGGTGTGAGTGTGTGTGAGTGTRNGAKNKNLDRKDAIAVRDMLDNYDDKIGELKKKRSEARWNVVKGVTETGGAIAGGIAGAAIGSSTGEIDDIIKSAGFGIGAGDWVGEKSVDFTKNRIDNASDIGKFTSKEYNRGKDLLSKRDEYDSLISLYKDRGNEAKFKKEYMSMRTQNKNIETRLKQQKTELAEKLKNAGHDINNI